MSGQPTLYEQCEAFVEAVNKALDPERLVRAAVEGYNEQMARINGREAP